MIPGSRGLAMMASVMGLTGVILAAMGAHLEGGIDNFSSYRSWQSASIMQLVHAAALLGLASLARNSRVRLWGVAGLMMFLGIILFSGTIYLSVLSGTDTALAPWGGGLVILSWLVVGLAAVSRPS